jgi:hypothetical protein
VQIEGDYYSREGIKNVRMWPYYAPNPLCGGASKGARSRRVVALLRPADGTSKGCKNVALPRFRPAVAGRRREQIDRGEGSGLRLGGGG